MSRSPSLTQVIRDGIESRLREVHTAMVGQVTAYDPAKQTVDVQPTVKRVFVDGDGVEVAERYPQIPSVPVAFPQAGGFFLSFPIQPGDFVLLVFAERPIDLWWEKGSETDPGDLRMHSAADAVAIPGVVPKSKALASADPDTMAMGSDTGKQIHITADTVALGSKDAADAIALASKVDARLTALENHYIAHTHPVPGITPGPGAAVAGASTPPLTPGSSTASTVVKAE